MGTYVLYAPENRELDLTELSSADYALVTGLHGQLAHGDRVLQCLDSPFDSDDLYVTRRDGEYVAEHFVEHSHGRHRVARESDEHLWQKEYWFRAAQDSGHTAARSFRTGTGTVLDVAIKGDQRTGVDIQRSNISPKRAVNRTLKSYRAGWLSVWFADSDRSPRWLHHVPSVRCNPMRWDHLLARGEARVAGLRVIKPLECTVGAFNGCPAGAGNACRRFHPKFLPWHQMTVDDLAAMVPDDQVVPLQTEKGHVFLVPPSSQKLYYELTGVPGTYIPGQPAQDWTLPGLPDPPCDNAAPPRRMRREGKKCEGCGQLLLLVEPGRTHCQACRPMPMGPSWV